MLARFFASTNDINSSRRRGDSAASSWSFGIHSKAVRVIPTPPTVRNPFGMDCVRPSRRNFRVEPSRQDDSIAGSSWSFLRADAAIPDPLQNCPNHPHSQDRAQAIIWDRPCCSKPFHRLLINELNQSPQRQYNQLVLVPSC